ncbi:DNA-binding protein [Janibacter hoylei]|uniref:DNA-binding protein n=1 Tax=Janibacter hoylei TaxID=364298 RepID=UPI00368C12F5
MSNAPDPELRALAEHLVGPAEIGELLGVDPNTVNVWKVRHAQFPQPVRRLRSGDIWDQREIIAWATATGRYPADARFLS